MQTIRALALAGLLSGASALPALAQDIAAPGMAPPEPTQRYRVVEVAADDVLNMRDFPGTGSDIVGTIAPDAEGIVVTGTRMRFEGGVWWQVVSEGTTGWVNARFLAPDEGAGDEREGFALMCTGTEPFWGLSIAEGLARFDSPEENQSWEAGPMTPAIGLVGRYAITLSGEEGGGHVAAWRNPNSCSDGMSDFEYPYEAIVSTPDGRVFGGCCRRGAE